LLKFAVEKFMCEDVVAKARASLSKQMFVDEINGNLHFVRAKPFTFLLEELFDKSNEGGNKFEITNNDFRKLMELIFHSYSWPRKTGELRQRMPFRPKTDRPKLVRV
jgi:hypothetical protein